MSKPTFRSSSRPSSRSQSRLLWYGAGAALVLFVVIALLVSRGSSLPFKLTGGQTNPLILLRNEATVSYEFTYEGASPAVLQRLIPRIQLYRDQVLVADVQRVYLVRNGETIELDDGDVPEGTTVEIQPGEVFGVDVVYLGQELGWNRIYGFRIQYTVDGRAVDGELTLRDDYYVFVE